MRKFVGLCALLSALCMLTACSNNEATDSDTSSSQPAGDFNFMQQAPVQSQTSSDGMTVGQMGTASEVGGGLAGTGNESTSGTTSQDDESSSATVDSGYKDLSSNSSLRLGTNVYVSIPTSAVKQSCTLSDFIHARKQAYNLVPEVEKYTLTVQKKVYKYGTCFYSEGSKQLVKGLGFSYWCTNTPATLDEAKSVTIKNFNLGTLDAGDGESFSESYNNLGGKESEEETEQYYRAVYTIADVAGNDEVSAYAGVIFDKQTGTLITCMISSNNRLLKENEQTYTADIAIDSFRYDTSTPSNLVSVY